MTASRSRYTRQQVSRIFGKPTVLDRPTKFWVIIPTSRNDLEVRCTNEPDQEWQLAQKLTVDELVELVNLFHEDDPDCEFWPVFLATFGL
jgi:hypothetical protein